MYMYIIHPSIHCIDPYIVPLSSPRRRCSAQAPVARGGAGRGRRRTAEDRAGGAALGGAVAGFRGFDLENPRKNGDFMTMAMEDTMKIYHEHNIPCFEEASPASNCLANFHCSVELSRRVVYV